MGHYYRHFLRHQGWYVLLAAIALFAFHAVSTLVFSVLGLSPSSSQWGLALVLGSFLALAGGAAGLRSKRLPPRLTSMVSGALSFAVLGFFSAGQLGAQAPKWAVIGAVIGGAIGAIIGFCTARRSGFWQSAIALCGGLCAYGAAFGFGTWMFAAITVNRWMLAGVMGLLTGLYLWFTRRALGWSYRPIPSQHQP